MSSSISCSSSCSSRTSRSSSRSSNSSSSISSSSSSRSSSHSNCSSSNNSSSSSSNSSSSSSTNITATTSVLIKYSHIFLSFKQWMVHINTTSIMKHDKGLWKMHCERNGQYKIQRLNKYAHYFSINIQFSFTLLCNHSLPARKKRYL